MFEYKSLFSLFSPSQAEAGCGGTFRKEISFPHLELGGCSDAQKDIELDFMAWKQLIWNVFTLMNNVLLKTVVQSFNYLFHYFLGN